MLGISLSSPVFTCGHTTPKCFPTADHVAGSPNSLLSNVNILNPNVLPTKSTRLSWTDNRSRRWRLRSTAQTADIKLTDEDMKSWETCKEALSDFSFSPDERDKILGKAFGHIHSPYWSEERKVEVPKHEVVSEILNYLRSLMLSDDDISKMLKKFPEVLGCNLEDEVKNNVTVLEKNWGITGKNLTKLLVRNPKVLGFNVDCKGDCMAQCTRCWARF